MELNLKERLLKTIENYNSNLQEKNDATIDEKITTFFSKLMDNLKNTNDDQAIQEFLTTLFKLDFSFYKKYGDDLLEKFWGLYNTKEIQIENHLSIETLFKTCLKKPSNDDENKPSLISKGVLYEHLVSQFLQFNPSTLENLLSQEIISKEEFHSNFKVKFICSKETLSEFTFSNKLSRNNLVDIIILLIYSIIELQQFYISLSTFIVSTNSNSVLLFKIISLFSMCLMTLENKAKFIDSLLFVLGGVLRDHARSYLKTKNRFNESLTYHMCKKKHKEKEHHFNDAVILSSLECDYLEQNCLSVVTGFLLSIVTDLKFIQQEQNVEDKSENKEEYQKEEKNAQENEGNKGNNNCCSHSKHTCKKVEGGKWEDCREIYYKYLDLEELDVEEQIDSNISALHYIYLFLSDFIFFFIANLTELSKDCKSKQNTYINIYTNILKYKSFIHLF